MRSQVRSMNVLTATGPARYRAELPSRQPVSLRGLLRPDTATDAGYVRAFVGAFRRNQCRIGRWVALGILVDAAVEPIASKEAGGDIFLGVNFGADDVRVWHF